MNGDIYMKVELEFCGVRNPGFVAALGMTDGAGAELL
jgi:hypothetical protein